MRKTHRFSWSSEGELRVSISELNPLLLLLQYYFSSQLPEESFSFAAARRLYTAEREEGTPEEHGREEESAQTLLGSNELNNKQKEVTWTQTYVCLKFWGRRETTAPSETTSTPRW